jgi:hypothetical protein
VADFDNDITGSQIVDRQLGKACNDRLVLLVDPERAKSFHLPVPSRLAG